MHRECVGAVVFLLCRWECPDFGIFSSSDVLMFKYSDQERGRYPFARDFYVLGNTSQINYSNALVQDMRDAFVDDLGEAGREGGREGGRIGQGALGLIYWLRCPAGQLVGQP
jgi:hypothetical protein